MGFVSERGLQQIVTDQKLYYKKRDGKAISWIFLNWRLLL